MNSLEIRNRKIIDAVIRKEQAVCPGAIALIGIYGSFQTGDIHPLSDLDLLILINDDRGWQLGKAFIQEDLGVGHDIYCTTRGSLRQDAEYKHGAFIKEVNDMFHKATDMRFLEGTAMEVVFQDGKVKRYDMASLFGKYPQLRALEDRELFLSGKLMGAYGIMWNDDLDIETETIYEDGVTVREEQPAANQAASAVSSARAMSGMSQKQLAAATGIDQSDISKIERGVANPSVSTLERIAKALGGQLAIKIAIPTSK